MSRFNKWLPFFEESSKKRDVESWWKHIQAKVFSFKVQIIGLVSDRAKALIKLSTSAYLDIFSMPDFFHFMQDISRLVGCRIGLKLEGLTKKITKAKKGKERDALKEEQRKLIENQKAYRLEMEIINQTIQPFWENNKWQNAEKIEKQLLHSFTKIGRIGKALNLSIVVDKLDKILRQIPDIAKGVELWITIIRAEIKEWGAIENIPLEQQNWLEEYVLPYAYWEHHLNKMPSKASNNNLRTIYQNKRDNAKQNYEEHPQTKALNSEVQTQYLVRAFKLVASFQRSSSQVEGRNGYLSFIHHANRGMSKQRRQVLTVVHNFDTRRADGSTPAERLFQKSFPNLVDFLCENVTGVKEPRQRKPKTLIINSVQR